MIRWCLSLLLFFCCGAYAVSSAAKATPSFDCAKAKNEVERLICADEDLAKLDVEMNKSYHAFMKTLDESYYRNKLKRKQIDWLGYREKLSCFNTDDVKKVTCLKNAYQRRIENLNAWAARQNYDFFIDYFDYLEQIGDVGFRKRAGKFVSKLGEEYYIVCGYGDGIFPKFPEERLYFENRMYVQNESYMETFHQTEDYIFFMCDYVSDMLSDQSAREFVPQMLKNSLDELKEYLLSEVKFPDFSEAERVILTGTPYINSEKCQTLQRQLQQTPMLLQKPIIVNSFEELKSKTGIKCSYEQFAKIRNKKNSMEPPYVFYRLPKFGSLLITDFGSCFLDEKDCSCRQFAVSRFARSDLIIKSGEKYYSIHMISAGFFMLEEVELNKSLKDIGKAEWVKYLKGRCRFGLKLKAERL